MYDNLNDLLDIYGNMRYNLKRTSEKILAIVLVATVALGSFGTKCLAVEESTEISVDEESTEICVQEESAGSDGRQEGMLSLEASTSEDGGCIEVTLSSTRASCGVLVTLSYDPERFSFLTYAKSDALGELTNVSCSDSNGRLRILIDADENFFDGVWCRFFFSPNETTRNDLTGSELFFEMRALIHSAYEKTETGYSELRFEETYLSFDCYEWLDREPIGIENDGEVSMQRIESGNDTDKYRAFCISGRSFAAGFAVGYEISVSCEDITERYISYRSLPLAKKEEQDCAVILFLPSYESFYVSIQRIVYSGKRVVGDEETYCFFVSGSNIERVGYD